jgi:ribosomal protein S18 acetylase RimI-like enzyme
MTSIIPYAPQFAAECADLIDALPDWFGLPVANAAYLRNLDLLPSWLAFADGKVVGAITLEAHFPGSFEIHFMAVHPQYHRQGIGRRLVALVEGEVRQRNGRFLHVKTLAPSDPDPYYAKTRAFYLALGFTPLFESDALWGPENTAVILVKAM